MFDLDLVIPVDKPGNSFAIMIMFRNLDPIPILQENGTELTLLLKWVVPVILALVLILPEAEPQVTLGASLQRNALKLNEFFDVFFGEVRECRLLIECQRLKLFIVQPLIYLFFRSAFSCIFIICFVFTSENLN